MLMRRAALLLFCLASGAQADAPSPPSPPATSAPAPGREIRARDNLLDFHYAWPSEALAIPRLNAHFEAEAAKSKAQSIQTAREDRRERGKDVPFGRHEVSEIWKTYGNTERLLSLGATIDVFIGGAERSNVFNTLLWDRKLGRPIELEALFDDAVAVFSVLTPAYCREFARARLERTGESMQAEDCRPLGDQMIAPLDRNGNGRFDALRVLIDPYGAPSRSEGSYEIDVPVDDEVLWLFKTEFAGLFGS